MVSIHRTLGQSGLCHQELAQAQKRLQASLVGVIAGAPAVNNMMFPVCDSFEYPLLTVVAQGIVLRRHRKEFQCIDTFLQFDGVITAQDTLRLLCQLAESISSLATETVGNYL